MSPAAFDSREGRAAGYAPAGRLVIVAAAAKHELVTVTPAAPESHKDTRGSFRHNGAKMTRW